MRQAKPLDDPYIYRRLKSIFLHMRGYEFRLPSPGSVVVLLVSGGMDSLLLWGYCMDVLKLHVYPIHIERKQGEKKAVLAMAAFLKKNYPGMYHEPVFKQYTWMFGFRDINSIRLDPLVMEKNINPATGRYEVVNNPSRLGVFSFVGYEYALLLKYGKQLAVNTILTGIMPEDTLRDHSSTMTALRSANLTLCQSLNDYRWQLSAPVEKEGGFYLTKKKLLMFGHRHNYPLNSSWSCHFDRNRQCGKCSSCMGRKNLFADAGLHDGTRYGDGGISAAFKKQLLSAAKGMVRVKRGLSRKTPEQPIPQHAYLRSSADVVTNNIKSEVFLLHSTKSLLLSLNDTGGYLWLKLNKNPTTLPSLARSLSRECAIPYGQALKDVTLFTQQLYNDGFIEVQKDRPLPKR